MFESNIKWFIYWFNMLRSVIVDIKVRYIIDKDKSFKILVIFNILNLLLFIYLIMW